MIPHRGPLWAGEAVEFSGEQQILWGGVGDQELSAVNVRMKAVRVLGRSMAAEQQSPFSHLLPSDSSFLPGVTHPGQKEWG